MFCWKFLSSIIAMHIMSLSLFWSNAVFLFIGPFLKAPLQRFNFPNIPCLKKSHVIFVIFSPQTKMLAQVFSRIYKISPLKKKIMLVVEKYQIWTKNATKKTKIYISADFQSYYHESKMHWWLWKQHLPTECRNSCSALYWLI